MTLDKTFRPVNEFETHVKQNRKVFKLLFQMLEATILN